MPVAQQSPVHDWSKQYELEELESIFRVIKAEKAQSSRNPSIPSRPNSGRPQRRVHLPHTAFDHDPSLLHSRYVATNRAAHRRPAAGGAKPVLGVNTQLVAPEKIQPKSHGTNACVQDPARSRGSNQPTQIFSPAWQAVSDDIDSASPTHPPVAPSASSHVHIASQVNSADSPKQPQRPSTVDPICRPSRPTGPTASSRGDDFTRYHHGRFQHSTDDVNWRKS